MWLAHGVGGRQDLPIPLGLALAGALAALAVSFVALGALWRAPRLGTDLRGARALPAPVQRLVTARAWPWTWRLVGLAATAYFGLGFAGPDTAENPTAGVVYVLFWVGLLALSLLFGPVWRGLNPLRTLHLLGCLALRRDPRRGVRDLPAGLGYWPAAGGLFAFVWLELVAPHRVSLPVIGGWLGAYAAVMLAGAAVHGSRWFDRADAFEVYSAVAGRLAVLARRRDGLLVWRHPFDGIAGLRPAPGLVAFVVVLLGSTMYDSLSNAPLWVRLLQTGWAPGPLLGTAGLALVIGVVLAAYLGATGLAARLGGRSPGDCAGELAHAVVPVAVGYLVAHYLTLFVLEGQRTLALLSDPLGTGADWLGTGSWQVRALGTSPAGTALLQVTVIVIGHVVGTLLAHDRALRLFDRRSAVVGQLPLLALMLAYTCAGLLLLFAA
ncbi:hypothetical protein ACN27G_10530 [Plantactinospora sp. WMMB334]|uniref:hypothetical protein n=1 Tax=Plantactinospora sp. WMMB334 TaxID=3404119 RepID=UPI003B9518E5